jgi:NADH dehydrogenase
MKVFVTGATGFVGQELLQQLRAAGHVARCLVRRGSEGKLPTKEGIEVRYGDATDPLSLAGALEGCQAVIHLVGIIREVPFQGVTFDKLHPGATGNLVAAAETQGVQRYLQMSANGARPEAVTDYHRSKWQAEEKVRASSLQWTIFRPSLIFGPGDQFVNKLADLIRTLPVVPVIGDGRYPLSPVAVQDVATGLVRALERDDTVGQTYHCCGPQSLTYDEILDLIGKAVGKTTVRKLHHPLWLMKPLVALLDSLPFFPITANQLTMLLEGNVCDPTPWAESFAINPQELATGIRSYLKG